MKIPTLFFALRCMLTPAIVAITGFALQGQASMQSQLDSMHRHFQTVTDPEEKVKTLNAISFQYLEIDAQKALEYGQQALKLATEHGLMVEMGKACNHIASHYIVISDLKQAIQYYEQSLQYFQQAGEEKGVAAVLGNLGYLNYYQGNHAVSLDYQLRALRIFEKLNNPLGMGNTTSAIGTLYMEQEQYDKAVHYDTIALKYYREADSDNGIAVVLGNLGNIYSKQDKQEQAKAAFIKAIETFEKVGNMNGVARNLCNVALIYNNDRNYQQALTALKKARDQFVKSNNLIGICHATGNMGSSYFLSYKNFDRRDSVFQLIPGSRSTLLRESIRLFKEAVGMAQQSKDLKLLSGFSELLAQVYDAAGDAPNAYAYFKTYITARDSLHSIETKREIEKLTTEREVELKNKQIELDRLAVQKKRNERVYFIIGMGLLLLSVLFVYRNFVNQKKSNVQLDGLNKQIAETNHELADKNLHLSQTLDELNATQEQLIETEKQKENALIRSRISQDIHDDISSGLTKISWLAETFMAKAAPLGVEVGLLEKINAYSRETVSKVGEIIWSSNPDRDNIESLLAYMRSYIQHYMEDAPMRYRIDFPEQTPDLLLNPELRRNLYLVMKEALHNARKYSGAQEITVAFAIDNGHYRLSVSDDGVGMTPGKVRGSGNGMVNMKRRIAAIGGRMQVETAPGQGVSMIFEGELQE